jgi:hypothetical protein
MSSSQSSSGHTTQSSGSQSSAGSLKSNGVGRLQRNGNKNTKADVVIGLVDVVIININEKNVSQSPSSVRLATMQNDQNGSYLQRVPLPVFSDGTVDLMNLISEDQLSIYREHTNDIRLDRLRLTPLHQSTHTSSGRNALFRFRDESNYFCDGFDLTPSVLSKCEQFVESKFILCIRLSEEVDLTTGE